MVLIVVVLPAPFGPSSPKIFPGLTVNEILSTAKVELNLFTRFLTVSIFLLKYKIRKLGH
jgi:hypothetical protein